MTHRIFILFSALLISWTLSSQAQATGAPPCGAHENVVQALDKHYSEKATSMGLASNGSVIELMTSAKGTWTLIMTKPSGVACVIAAGKHWENLPEQLAGVEM